MNEFENAVLAKLERIALAQEANANFQRSLIAIFTPVIPAMLASFSVPSIKPMMTLPTESPKVNNG